MCGIAGYFLFSNAPAVRPTIHAMTRALQHRGPDAEGIWTEGPVALGHRRLSIIDLHDRANQPLWDTHQRYAILLNGEIYNYREVKSRLTHYPFKTQGDTEVVLAAFLHWGWSCLEYLNGMFAFAIWDRRDERFYLARDRMGVKPLYYYRDNDQFLFASEIRSLLASGSVRRDLSPPALLDYLQFQSFQCPQTLVKNVWELPAASYLEIGRNHYRQEQYWSLVNAPSQAGVSSGDAQKKIRELLLQSVRRRMVADVPVAAFLSGGIDSSAVVALMAELTAAPQTFTVSFQEKQYDESAYAETISRKFGTRHHRILCRPQAFLDEFSHALNAMDSPSGDGINSYIVAQAVRQQGIHVALSGIGGDELFAGYPIFRQWKQIRRNRLFWKLPAAIRAALAQGLPGNNIRNQRLSALVRLPRVDIYGVYPLLRQVNSLSVALQLLTDPPPNSQLSQTLLDLKPRLDALPEWSQLSVAEFSSYTRQTLFRDTDQMSMAHALEVREPFFDHELVEYVLGLPDRVKAGRQPKSLLVQALGDALPREIYQRPKMGFVLPGEQWFRNELKTYCGDKIRSLSRRRFFQEKPVLQYWDDFLGRRNRLRWTHILILVALEHYIDLHQLD